MSVDTSFFEVEFYPEQKTAILYMNRPEARNAMDDRFWFGLPHVIDELEADPKVRVVIVAGRGKSFSTGLDVVNYFDKQSATVRASVADEREGLRRLIMNMQEGMNRMERGSNVYIAAVHKHCIGGALDLIAACDIRLASKDASISLREAKVAIVADMGSLNRLPGIIGMGNTKLMALTAGDFNAESCREMGLVSTVYENQESLMAGALKLAAEIASNSSIAVRGTKHILNYVQDHSIADGIEYVATWNTSFLDSEDLRELVEAFRERRRPNYKD